MVDVAEHNLWETEIKPKYGKQMLMLLTCDNEKMNKWKIMVIEVVQ